MSAQLAAHGRLGAEPVLRTSQSGTPWATASIAVDLGGHSDDDRATSWFGIVAFGKVAETLARHGKGDMISVAGRVQLNRWKGQNGEEREQLQIVTDAVVSAKSVRPGGGKRRDQGASDWGDRS